MRFSDWISGVCSSDLRPARGRRIPGARKRAWQPRAMRPMAMLALHSKSCSSAKARLSNLSNQQEDPAIVKIDASLEKGAASCSEATPLAFRRQESCPAAFCARSEEHTYELQSLMRITYAVFSVKKKN